jgi:hypothetical protein
MAGLVAHAAVDATDQGADDLPGELLGQELLHLLRLLGRSLRDRCLLVLDFDAF